MINFTYSQSSLLDLILVFFFLFDSTFLLIIFFFFSLFFVLLKTHSIQFLFISRFLIISFFFVQFFVFKLFSSSSSIHFLLVSFSYFISHPVRFRLSRSLQHLNCIPKTLGRCGGGIEADLTGCSICYCREHRSNQAFNDARLAVYWIDTATTPPLNPIE